MWYVGIDPGKGGGIAVIDDMARIYYVGAMPETERDLLEVLMRVSPLKEGPGQPVIAVLERVWASPQMGRSSAFTFGVGIGALRMALTAARIPYSEITPQRWQQSLGCSVGKSRANLGSKGGDKNITKRRAQQLFPDHPKITHAIADALLIAWFCRLTGVVRGRYGEEVEGETRHQETGGQKAVTQGRRGGTQKGTNPIADSASQRRGASRARRGQKLHTGAF